MIAAAIACSLSRGAIGWTPVSEMNASRISQR